jgi:alpha-glucosidase
MDQEEFEFLENSREYMNQMYPELNKSALFSDETFTYRIPEEPKPYDTVAIRFRTAKDNVDAVFFICGSDARKMELEESCGRFDFYKIDVSLEAENIYYYFKIISGNLQCYYNRHGVEQELNENYSFGIAPGFSTPAWAKGAVIYQIFVDRFYNGDRSNDVENREYYYLGDGSVKVEEWDKYPANMDVRAFYGGDLQGVREKLDYLNELGVEVIYFNPLFVSPSNHKYDIQDYDYIDPHYGVIVKDAGIPLKEGDNSNAHASMYIQRVTNKENLEAGNRFFAKLVEEIHARGMRVILDGVFNHCGSFNKWLDRERIYEDQEGYEKGAYISKESPFHDFFKFTEGSTWPYNDKYDGWWGHETLPKLNYEGSKALYDYILEVGRKWVSAPYYADGWRLDVAADLGFGNEFNHKFWKDFRKAVKDANPEALILAEHYGEARDWLKGDEWDTVMNYDAFMEPVTWFLTGMEKHSDEYRKDLLGNARAFWDAMNHHMASFFLPSLQTSMNELSNHDHSRFLTRTNHKVGRAAQLGPEAASQEVNKAVFREAVMMQMTWPGAPAIYYGDEAGVCGFTDPDNRRTFPWGREDKELIQFHKEMIRIHKERKVLAYGSIKKLYGQQNIIAYGRFQKDSRLIVIINNGREEAEVGIPVWEVEIPQECMLKTVIETFEQGYHTEAREYRVTGGELVIRLLPFTGLVLEEKSL